VRQTLFISDLHLDASRPQIVALFLRFLAEQAPQAEALYILGDLFEYWIGDDMLDDPRFGPALAPIAQGLRTVSDAGVPVAFMHGNRDFLIGEAFAERCGLRLLPEAQVIDLHGAPTLLLHGDTLCTDDVDYQALRGRLRDPAWQAQFLALPLEERVAQAQALRARSREAMQSKREEIMDVNPGAVQEAFAAHGVARMIHGHTHRPAVHEVDLPGGRGERIVLGDWYEQGSVLRCDATGRHLEGLGA
jgi:UDP-2,3-diacylglucosamine hydrolase